MGGRLGRCVVSAFFYSSFFRVFFDRGKGSACLHLPFPRRLSCTHEVFASTCTCNLLQLVSWIMRGSTRFETHLSWFTRKITAYNCSTHLLRVTREILDQRDSNSPPVVAITGLRGCPMNRRGDQYNTQYTSYDKTRAFINLSGLSVDDHGLSLFMPSFPSCRRGLPCCPLFHSSRLR